MAEHYDIFIIGGGINGCGIARDAAGRGYSTYLAEMNDLASGTSSWSTKIIHGGLRYLEYYEFRLVQEALKERETLWKMAPHIIHPMRFVLPHHKGLRPMWLLRLGLFIYDRLGGRQAFPIARQLNLKYGEVGQQLKPEFTKGFEYSDCQVDDSRLVILNARAAAEHGAIIKPRTKVTQATRKEDHWSITTKNTLTGMQETITAKLLINAGGPWVDTILSDTMQQDSPKNIRLVQGSHIVIKKKFNHDRAYLFQNADKRICFAIPYQQDFTLIGTTDRDYDGDPSDVRINDAEIDYLLKQANEYFDQPINRDDIIWEFSGVRSLYDDGASKAQDATRDYTLSVEGNGKQPRLINIFGGKITTYRRLAESVLRRVKTAIGGNKTRWTAGTSLPGGDFPADDFANLLNDAQRHYNFIPAPQIERMTRSYGLDIFKILGHIQSQEELGIQFGHGLTQIEVQYLIDKEWAVTVNDILWRRTKLGLYFDQTQTQTLKDWMKDNLK